MNKICLVALSAVMFVSLLICGCDDAKPKHRGVESTDWEIWATGTLINIDKIDHPNCGATDKKHCSNHPQLDNYVFDTGQEVALHQILDPGTIIVGQTGSLYKNVRMGSKDCYAWFQWIIDTKVPTVKIPSKTEPKATTPHTTKHKHIAEANKPIWIIRSEKNPERFTPVLIKFKNDVLSIGYINNINEWKFSINKRKDDGGSTIPNNEIIFWKSVDIQ